MSAKSKKVPESEYDARSTEDDAIVWAEWSDVALNNVNWAAPKSRKIQTNDNQWNKFVLCLISIVDGPDGLFLDTHTVPIPLSLESHEWIRAKDLQNLTEPLTVFTTSPEYPDLITNNKHLLQSEFVRWFISTIINLQYCGRDGLEISGENDNFIWNGRQQPWKGWLNVYSMNKSGKGAQHRPVVNPNGKYIVRLFFLGSWRLIAIDDMIPINKDGYPLLPRTTNSSELWPMLLSKALLKICSLTWSQKREIVDFHPVVSLTGWVCLRLDIMYLSPQDKWDFLTKYAEHFEWTPEHTENKNQEVPMAKVNIEGKRAKRGARVKKSKDTVRTKKSKDTSRTKNSKENYPKLKLPVKPQPVTLFLGLGDIKGVDSEDVPGLSPCWSHFIYVAQSRDIPLDPKDVKPPLARWKLFRWLSWAIKRGLIDPVEYFVPIRSLKIVSPLKQCKESVLNMYSETAEEESAHRDEQNNRTASQKNKIRSASSEPEKGKPKEESTPDADVSLWGDFNKIEPHIKDVHFFYKLEYFQYTARISDSLQSKRFDDRKSETKKGSKRGSRKSSPSRATSIKEPDFIESHNWPQKMSKTRNEPLYLFCDSLEEKFFMINYSTFQKTDDPTLPQSTRDDYFVLEKHSWFYRPTKSHLLVSMSTVGTKATVTELGPGRHLLRIYCRSESRCFITISSDTIFYFGDRATLYQMMCTESERIDQIAKRISNCISNAYQSFGTANYLESIRAYYKSYMPDMKQLRRKDKALCGQIHEYFIEEQVQLLKTIFSPEETENIVRSLRIFFFDRTINLEVHDAISMMLKSLQQMSTYVAWKERHSIKANSEEHIDKNGIDYEKAATTIQSFFKMIIIRKYKAIHDPSHAEYESVLGHLLKVAELFNYNKRESLAYQLFRNVLQHHDALGETYPCFQDLQYVLRVQESKGTLTNIKTNQWLPIARLTVNPQKPECVFAVIDLFVNLPKYSLRVFNNGTGQEILRVVNHVSPSRYEYSKSGYTIFAYGWSEDQRFKELDWTMNIITMKGEPMFHLLDDEEPLSLKTEIPKLMVEELSNTYIPNSKNYISKWIVRVNKKSFVSFRLTTSYDLVEIRVRITDEKGRVLCEMEGKSVIIIPIACLEIRGESSQFHLDMAKIQNNVSGSENGGGDSKEKKASDVNANDNDDKRDLVKTKIYYVEAFVLNDSWPLTESEWAVVIDAKAKITNSYVRAKLSSASSGGRLSKAELARTKKVSRQSVDSNQLLESPYWILQVVTDVGSGVEISQDRTREKEIAQMKEAWAKENPDSLRRGKELRETFIAKHALTSSLVLGSRKSSLTKVTNDRAIGANSSSFHPQKLEPRTLKPPKTYRKLPALNFSLYMVKEDEEETAWVKTKYDEEALRNRRMLNIIYAGEDYSNFQDEMTRLLHGQRVKYRRLFNDHKEGFWERRDRVNDVYEARKLHIGGAKTTRSANVKTSTRDKKV